jgi:coproporphyrinogen III oxidase-like Fe-S oxidoreductase
MAVLYHEHGVRIFNFHDDNFFLPSREDNLRRFAALRSLLDEQGVGRIAIQVKARPDSIDEEVVRSLLDLGLFRVFLGVESNAVAGLRTLGRGIWRPPVSIPPSTSGCSTPRPLCRIWTTTWTSWNHTPGSR